MRHMSKSDRIDDGDKCRKPALACQLTPSCIFRTPRRHLRLWHTQDDRPVSIFEIRILGVRTTKPMIFLRRQKKKKKKRWLKKKMQPQLQHRMSLLWAPKAKRFPHFMLFSGLWTRNFWTGSGIVRLAMDPTRYGSEWIQVNRFTVIRQGWRLGFCATFFSFVWKAN